MISTHESRGYELPYFLPYFYALSTQKSDFLNKKKCHPLKNKQTSIFKYASSWRKQQTLKYHNDSNTIGYSVALHGPGWSDGWNSHHLCQFQSRDTRSTLSEHLSRLAARSCRHDCTQSYDCETASSSVYRLDCIACVLQFDTVCTRGVHLTEAHSIRTCCNLSSKFLTIRRIVLGCRQPAS